MQKINNNKINVRFENKDKCGWRLTSKTGEEREVCKKTERERMPETAGEGEKMERERDRVKERERDV